MSAPVRVKLMKVLSKTQPNRRRPKAAEINAASKKRWNIVRGDHVQVVGNHRDAGKQGKVLTVLRKQDRLIVEGINVATMYKKGNPERNIPGRSVTKERSIPYSSVNLVDPVTKQPTRITYQFLEDGKTKVRVAKKSGAIIPKPELLKFRRRPIRSTVTDVDTTEEHVWAITYEDYEPPSLPGAEPMDTSS